MIDRSALSSQFLAHCLPAMTAKSHLVLGIMSGTSIDGVDYALCEIGDERIRLRELWSAEFPRTLRDRLHDAARNTATSWVVARLHHDLGRFYASKAVRRGSRWKPQWVGLHGQTIFHHPARPSPATLQLGEPAYLAESLRVPVVSNFRVADLAAGGQGAPLATMFHRLVFGERGRHVCVNNLGGISNVTSIDWCHGPEPRVLAFDTGPANVLVDLAMRHSTRGRASFDAGGVWAAKGNVCERLLRDWLRHPYLRAKPPKSTGRELFGEPFFDVALREIKKARLSKFDAVATFAAFTAHSLAFNYRRHLPSAPSRIILTGGGAANRTLRQMIAGALHELNPDAEIQTSDELGWPVQSIEPAAFALLAWLRMRGRPGNLPETTGANRAVLLGQITEPTPGCLNADE
jgi:anhydro-N-acetylmuramic acid kinase